MTMSEDRYQETVQLQAKLADWMGEAQLYMKRSEMALVPMDDRAPAVCSSFTLIFNFDCGCAGEIGSTLRAPGIVQRCQDHPDETHDSTLYGALVEVFVATMRSHEL